MKSLFATMLLLLGCLPSYAATWYATASSANINATGEWKPTSSGSCTATGTALVWGAQAANDIFDANGCTAIAVNVDPGSGTWTGSSAGVCGTGGGTTNLETNATNGGGFTYASATNIVMHFNITGGGTTTVLVISGSTGGGTICGNIAGASGSASNKWGVQDTRTGSTLYVIGNLTGGSQSTAYGFFAQGTSAPLIITGNATAGTGNQSHGLYASNGSGGVTVTGNCTGSNTAAVNTCGCSMAQNYQLTLTGNIINGLYGGGVCGLSGVLIYTPAATNYVLYPKDSSYSLGTINSHATEMPTDPGVANVKSGVNYGSLTGTLSASGAVSAAASW